MKNSILKKLSLAFAGAAFSAAFSFSALAAVPSGTLEGADNTSIYGWVWDSDSYGHVIPVEISIYPTGSSEVLKTAVVKADHYQEKLQESIGDGYHGFAYAIDWNQIEQENLRVTAYAVTETDRVFLGELTYNKASDTFALASDSEKEAPAKTKSPAGPGESSISAEAPKKSSEPVRTSDNTSVSTEAPAIKSDTAAKNSEQTSETYIPSWQRGPGVTPRKEEKPVKVSLGMYTTTGYCNCDICCGGSKLTYSGTVPQPDHTISADISVFPIGTKLMIGDTVYTVEDTGSNVVENKIDIFYATHEEAVAHGTQIEEVFAGDSSDNV